jgi:hypothetical protein
MSEKHVVIVGASGVIGFAVTIFRPQVLLGDAPGVAMNPVLPITAFWEMTDAPLLADAFAWAFETLASAGRNSLWGTGGCDGWYLDKTGTPTLNPTTLTELKAVLAEPTYADYIEQPRNVRQLGKAA